MSVFAFIEDSNPYSDSDMAFTLRRGIPSITTPMKASRFVVETIVDGEPTPSDIYAGHDLKFAYAQAGPNSIIVSTFRDELALQ